jgi:hypothetical protein
MAETLANNNVALALLGNTIATGAILCGANHHAWAGIRCAFSIRRSVLPLP